MISPYALVDGLVALSVCLSTWSFAFTSLMLCVLRRLTLPDTDSLILGSGDMHDKTADVQRLLARVQEKDNLLKAWMRRYESEVPALLCLILLPFCCAFCACVFFCVCRATHTQATEETSSFCLSLHFSLSIVGRKNILYAAALLHTYAHSHTHRSRRCKPGTNTQRRV